MMYLCICACSMPTACADNILEVYPAGCVVRKRKIR